MDEDDNDYYYTSNTGMSIIENTNTQDESKSKRETHRHSILGRISPSLVIVMREGGGEEQDLY